MVFLGRANLQISTKYYIIHLSHLFLILVTIQGIVNTGKEKSFSLAVMLNLRKSIQMEAFKKR